MKNLFLIGAIAGGVFLLMKSHRAPDRIINGQMTFSDTQGKLHIITRGMDGTMRDEQGRLWV